MRLTWRLHYILRIHAQCVVDIPDYRLKYLSITWWQMSNWQDADYTVLLHYAKVACISHTIAFGMCYVGYKGLPHWYGLWS